LEHLHSNPVGVYGDVLLDRGIEVHRVRLDLGEALPDWHEYDLLVVMGGGMSVYEEDAYPWLVAEKRAIREAVATGCPYFGAWDPSCWRPRSARACSAGRSPSWASIRSSSARPPAATRSSGPSRPTSRCSSGTPIHSTCPKARCVSPAPPATKTRRSTSAGPRMRSSAIWSPRSTTSVTGSTRGPRSGRHS